jgi:hypothetical protein
MLTYGKAYELTQMYLCSCIITVLLRVSPCFILVCMESTFEIEVITPMTSIVKDNTVNILNKKQSIANIQKKETLTCEYSYAVNARLNLLHGSKCVHIFWESGRDLSHFFYGVPHGKSSHQIIWNRYVGVGLFDSEVAEVVDHSFFYHLLEPVAMSRIDRSMHCIALPNKNASSVSYM